MKYGHLILFLCFLIPIVNSSIHTLECEQNNHTIKIDHQIFSDYPWSSPYYKFIGTPDTLKSLKGRLLFTFNKDEYLCDHMNDFQPPSEDFILFVRDGRCAPETKVSFGTLAGAIGIVLYQRTSLLLQDNKQTDKSQVHAFSFGAGSLCISDHVNEREDIDTLKHLVESSDRCTIILDPDTYVPNESDEIGWILLSFIVGLYSIVIFAFASLKWARFIYREGLKANLRQIIMASALICSVIRMLYAFEPAPLGRGFYPYWMWCFLASSSVWISICSNFLIACYWKEMLELNILGGLTMDKISLPTMRWTFIGVSLVIFIVDSCSIILRALRIHISQLNMVSAMFYLVISLSLGIYFAYQGIRFFMRVFDKDKPINKVY